MGSKRGWVTAIGVGAVAAFVIARRRRGFVSTSVAARNARLASIGARTGARHAVHTVRRATASAERREELDHAHQMRTAEDVAAALGELKGALMKIGQMASYLDDGLPEPIRAALAGLQQDAPPMAPELCASVVRAELGAEPRDVFAHWDPIPLAAASIGQVHRATTRGGLAVAVKVQYPGVDEAIRADLVNSDLLFRMLGLIFPGLEPGPLVEELRARLTEELDYRIEAANQHLFADWYADHPFIHVPRVVEELSTGRVLTTELATGARFAEVEAWAQEERDAAAEAIFRFVFRSLYRLHAFNGDPHPGNYLFGGNGNVTFLDFGLVKRYQPDEVHLFQHLIRTFCVDRDIRAFRRTLEQHRVLQPNPALTDDDVRDYFGHFYEFVLEDRELTFDPDYSSETVRLMFDPTSPAAPVAKSANVPPAFVITQRINLGLSAVLGRLRARRNWRRIAYELWPFVEGEPSTPMGEAEAAWLATHPRAAGTEV
ncbi:MAG TPA: AarF/ABC1/UbiB kinase family protein [Acidimicrobiia bacterium]|nr:AarF/ABC1/UbiB kinase family protein [Acidimicrobiia bacterium]